MLFAESIYQIYMNNDNDDDEFPLLNDEELWNKNAFFAENRVNISALQSD